MTLFQTKYRTESSRLKDWDYSNPWWYYVTINTKNHEEYFGHVENGNMIPNQLCKIVEEEWLKAKTIRTNVDLDFFVVMPTHLHGIVIINGSEVETHRVRLQDNPNLISGDACDASLRKINNSLSRIIGGFKSAATKRIREIGFEEFCWQSRFYDRIIRNETELLNIRRYIEQNPLKWELEKGKPENIFPF